MIRARARVSPLGRIRASTMVKLKANTKPRIREPFPTKAAHMGWFRGTPFRSPLQGGLKGLGARGEGDEGLKVEGGFTFGRLQGGFKGKGLEGASKGLEGGFKGA